MEIKPPVAIAAVAAVIALAVGLAFFVFRSGQSGTPAMPPNAPLPGPVGAAPGAVMPGAMTPAGPGGMVPAVPGGMVPAVPGGMVPGGPAPGAVVPAGPR